MNRVEADAKRGIVAVRVSLVMPIARVVTT